MKPNTTFLYEFDPNLDKEAIIRLGLPKTEICVSNKVIANTREISPYVAQPKALTLKIKTITPVRRFAA
jgi:hypothetical protein